MARVMDGARMTAILAAYGAEPARWPAHERESALAWMTTHDIAAALAEARALDGALSFDGRVEAPSDALTARVLQGIAGAGDRVVPFPGQGARSRWHAGAIAALAACAVMGVVIGFTASPYSEDPDADAALGAALGVSAESGLPGGEG